MGNNIEQVAEVADLVEPCPYCLEARKLVVSLNNSAGQCYYLGHVHKLEGEPDRGQRKRGLNGPLDLICHHCGHTGQRLTRRGELLANLVRAQLDTEEGRRITDEQAQALTLGRLLALDQVGAKEGGEG